MGFQEEKKQSNVIGMVDRPIHELFFVSLFFVFFVSSWNFHNYNVDHSFLLRICDLRHDELQVNNQHDYIQMHYKNLLRALLKQTTFTFIIIILNK
jgi:hypothetical protein